MNPIIEITTPNIFENKKIISGVTRRNLRLFPEIGFNISPTEIISAAEVVKHKQILADKLSLPLEKCIFQKQVHEDRIDIITDNYQMVERDGMISNIKGIVLNINIADCCAVLFHDPVNNAVGAVHSGWRGTKLNISSKAIAMMVQEFSSDPTDMKVYLSPCASVKKYETGQEFKEYFPDSVIQSDGKYYFDNHKEIKNQLIQSEINSDNIEVSDVCTISNTDYHSFRRDGNKSGRMAAFIGIRDI